MFGCIYFPVDNTMSVVNKQKNVNCENFVCGERCEVKWSKGEVFEGTIIAVEEKEADAKKMMHRLLKEVLNTFNVKADRTQALLSAKLNQVASTSSKAVTKDTCTSKADKKTKKKDKQTPAVSNVNQEVYKDMVSPGHSLEETWDKVHGRESTFKPSEDVLQLLRLMVKPKVQQEIQEMLLFFGSKNEKEYTVLEEDGGSHEAFLPSICDMDSDLYTAQSLNQQTLPFSYTQQNTISKLFTNTPTQQDNELPSFTNTQMQQNNEPTSFTSSQMQQDNQLPPFTNTQMQPTTQPTSFTCTQMQQDNQLPPFTNTQMQPTTQPTSFTCTQMQQDNQLPPFTNTQMQPTTQPISFTSMQIQQDTLLPPFTNTQMQQNTQPFTSTPMQQNTQSPSFTSTPMQQTNQPISFTGTPMQQNNQPISSTSTPMHQHTQSPSFTDTNIIPRRSPRKRLAMEEPVLSDKDENVYLTDGVAICRKRLRTACEAALKNDKPGFTLMSKMLIGVFSTQELAQSRGLGIGHSRTGDIRPPLDEKKVKACKDYVIGWTTKRGLIVPVDKEMNQAVSEQTAYARKKIKKTL